MTVQGISENIVANIVVWALLVFVGAGISLMTIARRRARRLKALGVSDPLQVSEIPIFISLIQVEPGDAKFASGRRAHKFEASAVSIREYEAANRIVRALDRGFIGQLPELLDLPLRRLSLGLGAIQVKIRPAPVEALKDMNTPLLVVVGGPEFNKLTEPLLTRAGMAEIVDPENCDVPTIRLKAFSGSPERNITPDSPGYNLGLVQRSKISSGQTVIFLVGIRSNGTLAAIDWFVKEWDNLNKYFGDKDFVVCLECPTRTEDPNGWERRKPRLMDTRA
jgi:hypothetical protein